MTQRNGRIVAITGAARGIGRATAIELSRRGALVAIGDIDETAAKAAAALVPGRHHVATLDVTDRGSFTAFLDGVEADLGPLDVLVNNAGIMPVGPFHTESDDTARRQIAINIDGVVLGSKLALERMLPRRRGHLINIASGAGFVPAPGIATYCGTKHFVVGMTAAIRAEYEGQGVDISMVSPGVVRTELTSGLRARSAAGAIDPEDVARCVGDLVEKPRPEVFVPSWGQIAARAAKALPPSIVDRLLRRAGADKAFVQPDTAARAAYLQRTTG